MAGQDLARARHARRRSATTARARAGPHDRRDRHRHQGARWSASSSRAGRASDAPPLHEQRRAAARGATRTRSFWPTARATRRRCDYIVDTVRALVGKKPVWGICLGHQLLCRAVGLETFKLPFGHHGANHPVKDLPDRARRDHLPEPRLRGARARRRAHDRPRRAGALGNRLRRRRAVAREPLRPHRRGPGAARRAGRHRPVSPRGRSRAARQPVPVRSLPRAHPQAA